MEQNQLNEERKRLELERLRLEREKNRKLEEKKERPPMPDNSQFYRAQKNELANQMRYYKEQRRRFSNQIRQYEEGQKLLEEENQQMLEDQRERERLRGSQQQDYDPFAYKNAQTKTFYTGYVQQKYKIADNSFPERNTYTINIKNSNINDDYNYGNNYSFKNVSHNSICPGCGKMVASYVGRNYSFSKVDHICGQCGKLKQA